MADDNPYVPSTVPELVDRLAATVQRWRDMHAEAESHAQAQADQRND